jgi:hypothetical protein
MRWECLHRVLEFLKQRIIPKAAVENIMDPDTEGGTIGGGEEMTEGIRGKRAM